MILKVMLYVYKLKHKTLEVMFLISHHLYYKININAKTALFCAKFGEKRGVKDKFK